MINSGIKNILIGENNIDYAGFEKIIPADKERNNSIVIDLSRARFFPPWGIAGVAMLMAEFSGKKQLQIIVPNVESCHYLQRMKLGYVAENFGFNVPSSFKQSFIEHNPNGRFIELTHLKLSHDFYSSSFQDNIYLALSKIGIDRETIYYINSLIAELIDNIFSHNLGKWPLERAQGGLICMQVFPRRKEICIAIGDFGLGIKATFNGTEYESIMTSDEVTIKNVLKGGYTSRPSKRGGNGIKYVLDRTLKDFGGTLDIRSGKCHVRSTKDSTRVLFNEKSLVGTLIQLTIEY